MPTPTLPFYFNGNVAGNPFLCDTAINTRNDFSFTDPLRPAYGSGSDTKLRVLKTQFGDGYEQRTPDGINNIPRTFPLTFKLRPEYATALTHFVLCDLTPYTLREITDYFYWTPPDGIIGKFVVDESAGFRQTYDEYSNVTVTVTFREVFDPA